MAHLIDARFGSLQVYREAITTVMMAETAEQYRTALAVLPRKVQAKLDQARCAHPLETLREQHIKEARTMADDAVEPPTGYSSDRVYRAMGVTFVLLMLDAAQKKKSSHY